MNNLKDIEYLHTLIEQNKHQKLMRKLSSYDDLNKLIHTNNNTLLHVAVDNCKYKIAKLLLENHMKPYLQNSFNETPLHCICMMTPYSLDTYTNSVIHQEKIFDLFMRHKKLPQFINLQDATGSTVLHYCVKNNNYHMVRILLFNNVDPTILDNDNRTARNYAQEQQMKHLLDENGYTY